MGCIGELSNLGYVRICFVGLVDGWTPVACLMGWLVLGLVDHEHKAVFLLPLDRLRGDR